VANRLLRDGLVDGREIVTHRFPLDEARNVMESIIDGTRPIVKAVMVAQTGR